MAATLREKTVCERLQIASEMWYSSQKMILAIVTAEYPERSIEEVQQEVAKRMSYGDSGAIQAMLDRSHHAPS